MKLPRMTHGPVVSPLSPPACGGRGQGSIRPSAPCLPGTTPDSATFDQMDAASLARLAQTSTTCRDSVYSYVDMLVGNGRLRAANGFAAPPGFPPSQYLQSMHSGRLTRV